MTEAPTMDNVFRALDDPTRRAIVERIARGPASVSELAAPFDMSLPAIHQHIQILRDAGIIQSDKLGRTRTCQLDARVLRGAEDWLSRRRMLWERRLDALGEHLRRNKRKKGEAR